MRELATGHETIGNTPNGPIVAIVFEGRYPPGSEGNDFARQMFEFVRTVVTETRPGAVVIDLTALHYVWGDAICTLAIPLFGTAKDFRPVVIVANGRTAQALRPLLEPRFALGLLPGMALFASRREAVEHLDRALALAAAATSKQHDADATPVMPTQENTIQVVAYDGGWPAAFAAEAARLRAALGSTALRIDHHGSTAVPGLGAKPIIDIQISVAALQPISVYGSTLEAIGYVHVPSPGDSFCPFFHRPKQWPHTHHVHVVERGGHEERRTLAFRDYLRNHPAVAREYEDLKRTIAAQVVGVDPESRERYAVAKSDFVERVVALAIARGYPAALSDR